MTRFTHAAAESASGATLLQYRTLVDLGVTSSTLYLVNGNRYLRPGDTNALANTYSPIGYLGGIEPIGDDADGTPRSVRLWLRAVNSADMYEALREDMFNRPVVVRRAFLDPVSDTLVSTPEQLWSGYVNKVEARFADRERGNFFEIEAETSLRRRAEAINFTRETLQTVLSQSGDTFFDFIHQVPLSKALWGQQPTAFNGAGPAFGHDRQGVVAGAVWRFLRKKP